METLKRQVALHDEARKWATSQGEAIVEELRAPAQGEFPKLARTVGSLFRAWSSRESLRRVSQ